MTVEKLLKDGQIPFVKRPTFKYTSDWSERVVARIAYEMKKPFIDMTGKAWYITYEEEIVGTRAPRMLQLSDTITPLRFLCVHRARFNARTSCLPYLETIRCACIVHVDRNDLTLCMLILVYTVQITKKLTNQIMVKTMIASCPDSFWLWLSGFCYGENNTTPELHEETMAECGTATSMLYWLEFPVIHSNASKR